MVLTGQEIIKREIITNLINAENQVQPCGVDLTVAKIELYKGFGVIDFDNSHRALPRLEEAGRFNSIWHLGPGAYLVTFNEVVNVPADYMGLARPRSSLLRMGATMNTSVWDPGYEGRSQCMLVVHNTQGIKIHQNAKLLQIIFMPLEQQCEQTYQGVYQGENL